MSAGPIVRAVGFGYRYPDREQPSLSGLDLEIEPGEVVLLAGDSGSGKSTVLRALCGLIPHYFGGAASGRLEVGGVRVRDHGPAVLAEHVGYCAQEPETQLLATTVGAELSLPLELAGWEPGARAATVAEVAGALGAEGLIERPTSELSGGEAQRVALAAALVRRPALLLLDEPTSQLDDEGARRLIELLANARERWGIAIVVAEHRVGRVAELIDRTVHLDRGRRVRPEHNGNAGPPRPADPDLHPAAGAPADLALAARGLVVSLRTGGRPVRVLNGFEIELGRGEIVALTGPNGAGKSTALRALAGRIEPDSGEVRRPGPVAFLPQRVGDLIVADTVAGEFRAGREAPEVERFGLAGLADSDPRDLSGGERQRLAIAIATAGVGDEVAAVLLDEPSLGMDRARRVELGAWLHTLAGQGIGVLVATHDREFAAGFCDREVVIGPGRAVDPAATATLPALAGSGGVRG